MFYFGSAIKRIVLIQIAVYWALYVCFVSTYTKTLIVKEKFDR